jgi:hypothetical protein
VLAAVAIVAYLPIIRLPFIQDGYVEIREAVSFGMRGWVPLWQDYVQRTRFTYMFLSYSLEHFFGFTPVPFYCASILLHVLCTFLVYAISRQLEMGRGRAAVWAGCFFAAYEGHQEAVMWTAGCSELMVFLFGVGAVLLWLRWLESGNWRWFVLSLCAFAFALVSKESVWILPWLMLLLLLPQREYWRRGAIGMIPYIAAAGCYVLWEANTMAVNARFGDRAFSLSAPWRLNVLHSFWHLLLPWGLLAAGVLIWTWQGRQTQRVFFISCGWMILGIVPYSFLTYMPRVPSRQTYLASAGLGWLVGAALEELRQRVKKPAVYYAVAMAVVGINIEILWVKKMAQYRERAEPTELLKRAANNAAGPIHIQCAPIAEPIAEYALRGVSSGVIFDRKPIDAGPHCFSVSYRTRAGEEIKMTKRLGSEKHGPFW